MNRRRLLNLILAGMTLPVGLPAFAARQQLKGARADDGRPPGAGHQQRDIAVSAPMTLHASRRIERMGMTKTTTLVELQPTGPVKLADFLDSYDDGGAAVGQPQSSQGKIIKIVPDQSFTVRFTGTRAFEARYVRVGNAYRVEGGEANMLQGC